MAFTPQHCQQQDVDSFQFIRRCIRRGRNRLNSSTVRCFIVRRTVIVRRTIQ